MKKYVFQYCKVWKKKVVSISFWKVWASAQKLEINDSKLSRIMKDPSRYGQGEVLVDFVSIAKEHYCQIFY